MRYCQLNHISVLEPGKRIEATRTLQADEDYLRDHFPRFAVMPGVLMLESLFQAAALLVRETDGYQNGLVLLHEAKNVKFSDFVQPGQTLKVTAEIIKHDEHTTTLKATGAKGDSVAVSARLVLKRGPIEGTPQLAYADRHASQSMKTITQRLLNAEARA
jgi:3-hydroxyacyl-[acyl-carrier-protein] dehydratase